LEIFGTRDLDSNQDFLIYRQTLSGDNDPNIPIRSRLADLMFLGRIFMSFNIYPNMPGQIYLGNASVA